MAALERFALRQILLAMRAPSIHGTNSPPGSRARQLCPSSSDPDFLRDIKRVIDLDAEVSASAFYLCVAQKQLYRSQIAGAAVIKVALVLRMESDPSRFSRI